jgi:DNA-binding response OmpR family regulator
MLADDDPDLARLFQIALSQVDPSKNLIIARDGAELLDLLDVQMPEFLFLDLHMPCKNGYECLHEIRQKRKLIELPVVVYSSSSHMPDIIDSYTHQADLYMVKPFSLTHLKNALESILKMGWRNNCPKERYYFINNRFVQFTA